MRFKHYISYLRIGLVNSFNSDRKSFYVFLVVPIISTFLALLSSRHIPYKIIFSILGLIAFAYGYWLNKNNLWWQKLSSYYFDTYVNKLAIKATADEYTVAKIWLRNLYIGVSFAAPVLLLWAWLSKQNIFFIRLFGNLTLTGIPIAFFAFVDGAFIAIGLGTAFGMFFVILVLVALFLAWVVFQALVYLGYFTLLALVATIAIKLIAVISAYRKALEIRSLAKYRSTYSLEEFNQKVMEILFQTKSALPDYWEEKFKLREIRLLVEKMKMENQEKEAVLKVLKNDLYDNFERGLV